MGRRKIAKKLLLVGGDFMVFYFGLWLSLYVRYFSIPTIADIKKHIPLFTIVFTIWIVVNYINELYDLNKKPGEIKFYRRIWEAAGMSFLVSIVFFYVTPSKNITPKTILLFNIFFGYGLATIWKYLAFNIILPNTSKQKILFVGFTKETKELISLISNTNQYKVAGCISRNGNKIKNIKNFGSLKNITNIIEKENIDTVVIAPHIKAEKKASKKLYELLFLQVELKDLSHFYEEITGRVPPSTFKESWFLDHLRNTEKQVWEKVRRVVDCIAGFFIGAAVLIMFPAIAIAIKATSKGPVLIKQERVGKNGKTFNMYKFRSMYAISEDGLAETDGPQFAKKNDSRITSIGKFLRKTHIDEFPQVWNVLKGDLTLIGPRPERPEIVEKLEAKMPYYSLRHVVKPGLTSWAVLQQNYTDTLEESLQKLQYDLFYIKNRSFLLDLSIGLRTVNVVVRMMGQ